MANDGERIHFEDHVERPGVAKLRSRSEARSQRSRSWGTSQPPASDDEKEVGPIFEDEVPPTEDRDFKHRQVFHGWTLAWLAYQSTGVIYGDIGTSPLYVYSSTFSSPPSRDDLLGALSLIIWTLTLVVSVKYVLIVLRADDEGEGGTFAVYNLLSRYCNIAIHDPKSSNTVKFERYQSTELKPSNRSVRSWLETSPIARGLLKTLAVFGVSLIMADGVLTPAQSVLGAIQGLEVVKPDISTGTIIGVSCAILIVLFAVQPLGIHRIASVFAPIVIIWLAFNLSFGIYNLAMYDAGVLKAFSPYFAGLWFVRNKTEGWKNLGGILLAFTGVEALFAALVVWRLNPLLVFAVWLPFVTFDGLYLTAALTKVPDGAWFTLLLAVILASIFILWRYGKESQWSAEGKNRYRLDYLVVTDDDSKPYLNESFGGGELSTIKGLGIFFDKAGDLVPSVYEHFLQKFQAHPEIVVFLHMRALSVPHVSPDERFSVTGTSLGNCYRLMIRHGYNDHVVTPDLGRLVYQELRKAVIQAGARLRSSSLSYHHTLVAKDTASEGITETNGATSSSSDVVQSAAGPVTQAAVDAQIGRHLAALDAAFATQVVYMLGKEQLRITPSKNIFGRALLGTFLFIRENTRAKVASLKVPIDKLVEVGFVKEI
ncbi:MAG: hypothetical protein Q9165_005640 [Trypethelium subeluteriae]